MKTLLIWLTIMLQCLPAYAGGVLMMGGGVAAVATCSSGTANVVQESQDGSGQLNEANSTSAQSFQVTSSGTLYSISLNFPTVTTAATVTMRIGTSNNLSTTYLDQASVAVSSTGAAEFVFPNHPSLSTSTTYYFMFGYAGTVGDLWYSRSLSDPYAFGNKSYGYTTLFYSDNEQLTQDTYFTVKLCD